MTSAVRSVNVGHVNRLVEAVRIGGEFSMEKLLRVASDIEGYTPSGITREHLLAVLEAIREGEPVDRDIWARNDPERNR